MTLVSTIPQAARGRWQMAASRQMIDIHVGGLVTYEGRVLRVRGLSPMSASPRRVLLEDVETGEDVEARLEDIEPYDDGASA
jgi:hypothetical protein